MRDLAEYVAGQIDRLRHTSPQMGLIRVGLASVCLLAVVVVRAWTGGDVGGLLVWLTAGLAAVTVLRPDSPGVGGLLAVLGLWWLAGAPGAESWQQVTVIVLLAAIHVLAAQADAIPSHASLSPQAGFTMLVGSGAYVVIVGLAALLVLGVSATGAAAVTTGVAITACLMLAAAVVTVVLTASHDQ